MTGTEGAKLGVTVVATNDKVAFHNSELLTLSLKIVVTGSQKENYNL